MIDWRQEALLKSANTHFCSERNRSSGKGPAQLYFSLAAAFLLSATVSAEHAVQEGEAWTGREIAAISE